MCFAWNPNKNNIITSQEQGQESTQACRRQERVRAATAADTIVAARLFSSPMFWANPARNCRESSPLISMEVE